MSVCEECKINNREKYDSCKPHQGICFDYAVSLFKEYDQENSKK